MGTPWVDNPDHATLLCLISDGLCLSHDVGKAMASHLGGTDTR